MASTPTKKGQIVPLLFAMAMIIIFPGTFILVINGLIPTETASKIFLIAFVILIIGGGPMIWLYRRAK
jgi:hypothetical protein